jgi:hypothetical protein
MSPAEPKIDLFANRPPLPRHRLIACEVLYREFCYATAVSPNVVDLHFLTQGLHDLESASMRDRLQQEIDQTSPERYGAVLLGFALCNNGIVGLRARQIPLVVPRAHDCITLFLGSDAVYQQRFQECKGTYYLTTGWVERDAENIEPTLGRDDNRLRQMGLDKSYEEYAALYGEEQARMIMQTLGGLEHYSSMCRIDMGVAPQAEQRVEDAGRREAQARGWSFEAIKGRLDLIRDLVDGRWDDRFLRVEPGQQIAPSYDERILKAQ